MGPENDPDVSFYLIFVFLYCMCQSSSFRMNQVITYKIADYNIFTFREKFLYLKMTKEKEIKENLCLTVFCYHYTFF